MFNFMIKVITNNEDLIKKHLDPTFSFEKGLITVYVGWDIAKEHGASILNKKIGENTYWTFLPTEKRKIFTEDLIYFKSLIKEKIKKEVAFSNIDPLNFKNKEELLHYVINTFSSFRGYLFKHRIYFYNDKKVYHLDLDFLDFMSWDINDEIKKRIDIRNIKDIYYLEPKHIPYIIDAKENNIISDFC